MLKTHTGKPIAIVIPPGDYSEPYVFPEGAMMPGSVDESELACGICGDDGTMYDQDADGNDLVVPCVCVETEAVRAARLAREAYLKAHGFNEPTADECSANLALNVALREWPKP